MVVRESEDEHDGERTLVFACALQLVKKNACVRDFFLLLFATLSFFYYYCTLLFY